MRGCESQTGKGQNKQIKASLKFYQAEDGRKTNMTSSINDLQTIARTNLEKKKRTQYNAMKTSKQKTNQPNK
jgi:hypothetical protein